MSPLEKEIIRRKLAVIVENLAALAPIETMTFEEYLEDVYKRKAVERLLQELIEAAVDINAHLIVQTGKRAPDDYYESFVLAGELKIIPLELGEKLAPSAGPETGLCMNMIRLSTRWCSMPCVWPRNFTHSM